MKLVKNEMHEVMDAIKAATVPDLDARMAQIPTRLNEFGVDEFGFQPDYVAQFLPVAALVYKYYFRVRCYGIENIPKGRVLLIANHSGQIPIDGAMIAMGLLFEAKPPRMVRAMVEKWAPTLPFVSLFFQRCGQITGTPENCRRLLTKGETIMVFPEGVRGISKPFSKRYQLQEFGLGFMRLALETQTPIVPVAVVGAEEQAPQIANIKSIAKLIGAPAFPITPTFPLIPVLGALPYPTKYHIYFGEPLTFQGDPNDEDAEIERRVKVVKATIQSMLNTGVKARRHIFW